MLEDHHSILEGYQQYSAGLSCSTVEGASAVEGYLAVRRGGYVQYGGGAKCSAELSRSKVAGE